MTITIAWALMVIGMITVAYFIFALIVLSIQHWKEAERYDLNKMPDDLPKWDKLNTVGKMANKELKKMYRGNVKLYNDPRN